MQIIGILILLQMLICSYFIKNNTVKLYSAICILHFVKIPNTSENIWTLRFEIRFMPHRLSILRQRRAWPTIWMDNKFFTPFSLKMWRNCERYQNCVACWTLAGSQIELSQLENNFLTWFALLIKKKRQRFYLLLTIFSFCRYFCLVIILKSKYG